MSSAQPSSARGVTAVVPWVQEPQHWWWPLSYLWTWEVVTVDFAWILEQRGPPSGTNSARQSPAPQHRPLGLAPINPDRLGKGAGSGGKSLASGISVKVASTSFHLSIGELQKVKLEKKFPVVTDWPGPSTSTWHSSMLLQVLAAVIPRYKNPSRGCGDGEYSSIKALLAELPRSSLKQNVKTLSCHIRAEELCLKMYWSVSQNVFAHV